MINRSLVIKIFQTIYLVNVIFLFWLVYQGITNTDSLAGSAQIGILYGKLALALITITLLPGITRRLGLLPIVSKLIMPYRRHFGISTYLAVVIHSILLIYLPSLATKSLPVFNTFITFGFLALLTMTPLFITSNDYSVRLLKQNWFLLHKLVYLALVFILLHLALQASSLSPVAAALLAAEIISFITDWARKKQNQSKTSNLNQ